MGASGIGSEKSLKDAQQRKDRGKAVVEAAAGGDGGGGKGRGEVRAGKSGGGELGATGALGGTGELGTSRSGSGTELGGGAAEGGRDDAPAHGHGHVHIHAHGDAHRHEHKHGHEQERHGRHEKERQEHAHGNEKEGHEHAHRHAHGDTRWSGEEKKEEGGAGETAAAGSATPDQQRFRPNQGQRIGSSQRGALFESPQMQGRPRGGEISADEHADDEGSEGGSEGDEEDEEDEEEEGSEEDDDDFDDDDDYSTTDSSTGSDYTEDEDEDEEEEDDEQSSIVAQAKAQRAEAECLATEAAAEARAREREGSAVRVARAAVVERSQLVGVLEGERREAEARMREAAEQHRKKAEELRARVHQGFEAVTAESQSHAATRKERAAREAHYETEAASGMAALAAAQRALEEKVELLASDWATVHRLTEEIEGLEQQVQRVEAKGEGAAEVGAEAGRGEKGREEEGAAADVGGGAAAGEGAVGRQGAAEGGEGREGAGLAGGAGGGSDGGAASVGLLEGTLRQRRKEVALLRQQLKDAESAAAQQQAESEVESNLLSRLQQLTERLILKQQQVESLQIEKSTLSLRIETESAALQKDKHRLSTFLRGGRSPASAAVTARFLASTPGPLAADLAAAASAAEARALEEGGEDVIEGDHGFSREAILNRSRKLTLAQRDFGLGPTGNAFVVGVVDTVLGFDSLFLGSAGGVLRTNVVARTSLWVYLVVLHLWVAFVWLMHFPHEFRPPLVTITAMSSPLLAANVYISFARCASLLQSLASSLAASRAPTRILHVFEDEPYARTGVTLAGPARDLERTLILLSGRAIETVDLSRHVGSHPCIGVLDHVALRPLLRAELADAATSARNFPVHLYGAASPTNRPLDAIRRDLGYFRPPPVRSETSALAETSVDAAAHPEPPSIPPPEPSSIHSPEPPSIPPDFGPLHPNPLKGRVAVGGAPWVYNYNIPIQTPSRVTQTTLAAARRVARRVSERGGGVVGVQSMALMHGDKCVEIACNISEPDAPAAGKTVLENEAPGAVKGSLEYEAVQVAGGPGAVKGCWGYEAVAAGEVQGAVEEGVEREVGLQGARVLAGYSPGLTRQQALEMYFDMEKQKVWI
ncbi:unnamed protein product [Closterium sp. Naga37s-1]|nr:unnamed protein product [Closterium sp. Naga37s-1]